MVGRGQVLERQTIVRCGDFALEALHCAGVNPTPSSKRVLLVGPHPRVGGGNMDSAILSELVWWLARRGVCTLRFNWRGVSASQGVCTTGYFDDPHTPDVDTASSLDDLIAALDQHRTPQAMPSVVAYGFGATVLMNYLAQPGHDLHEVVLLAAGPGLRVHPHDVEQAVVVLPQSAPRIDVEQAREAGCGCMVVEDATFGYQRGLSAMASVVCDALCLDDAPFAGQGGVDDRL